MGCIGRALWVSSHEFNFFRAVNALSKLHRSVDLILFKDLTLRHHFGRPEMAQQGHAHRIDGYSVGAGQDDLAGNPLTRVGTSIDESFHVVQDNQIWEIGVGV